ncbi:nitrate reductase molybdenum cofactor assembly chaperone [Nocardiopsis sp. RSe5-2]|uniref:Nitrate reductase molybdenum cofactor assembly chaperone n=1 Tax=Nocardiopsis endophytica TaxID=3018445 RepID=A0ABT4U055_9ACTN|nr:nitrate reductase molybdenum cofactor assembly chaperone [Nocardiopsis endophytica]MDA2810307.1 nitrate reductase molybdenum cofactor assembly chaperone [Nocardiopsis endophytica]
MKRARDTAVVRRAAALLLDYPDRAMLERLPAVRAAVDELPRGPARDGLAAFCDYAVGAEALELGAHYVETFDMRRRRALHLTFYTDGDTRRRGHALARLKEVYAAHGWRLGPHELPDHLCVLLEFASRGDAAQGEALLRRFQPGLELLRSALHRHGTPYAGVLDAVAATLPPPAAAQRDAARRLAAQGPPAEDVGLEGYGGRAPGKEALPWPT